MFRLILAIMMALGFSTMAQASSWELSVVYPNQEQKKFILTDKQYQINLNDAQVAKTMSCLVSSSENLPSKYGPSTAKSVVCTSFYGGVVFQTMTSCYEKKSETSFTNLALTLPKKKIYVFNLTCSS